MEQPPGLEIRDHLGRVRVIIALTYPLLRQSNLPIVPLLLLAKMLDEHDEICVSTYATGFIELVIFQFRLVGASMVIPTKAQVDMVAMSFN